MNRWCTVKNLIRENTKYQLINRIIDATKKVLITNVFTINTHFFMFHKLLYARTFFLTFPNT